MLPRRYGTFTGGIELLDQKSVTLDRPIVPAPRPSRLLIPLGLCGGRPAKAVVPVGQAVEGGQRLAEAADPSSVDVFAPLAGRVASVESTVAVAGSGGFVTRPAVELVDLGEPPPLLPLHVQRGWLDRKIDAMVQVLHSGGLTTHRHPIEPLAAWLDRALDARCDVLIANAVEGQPYVTAEHRLLTERGAEVIAGLMVLAKIIGMVHVSLAVDHRRTGSYRSLARAARRHGIATIALPHKYPIDADVMLVKVLTRRVVPPGGTTAEVGVAVIDPASCFAVFRLVACGQPLTHRVVTVSGERAGRQENFWTPLGYPCAELMGGADTLATSTTEPVIHGGPMVGLRCGATGSGVDRAPAVVSPATDALLATDEAPTAIPTPCIRCGWCTHHCPVRLNVAVLNDDFELSMVDHARKIGVAACVDCGVCSYVCPARLPLTERVKQLKRAAARTMAKAAP